jgi:hypothetical protein
VTTSTPKHQLLNTTLETILRRSDVGWLLEMTSDAKTLLQEIGKEIDDASCAIASKLGRPEFDLFRELQLQLDTGSLKPLVQLFTSPSTKEMRAMVYCVLREDMEIKTINFSYELQRSISLEIVLTARATGKELSFQSPTVWDAVIFRHLGIVTINDKPILQGFFPHG